MLDNILRKGKNKCIIIKENLQLRIQNSIKTGLEKIEWY